MTLAVLRMRSRTGQPEKVAAEIGVECDAIWRTGDRGALGRVREDCGFIATVSDAGSVREMTEGIREFVQSKHALLSRVLAAGWEGEIDVAVFVGESAQFTAAVSLKPQLLNA